VTTDASHARLRVVGPAIVLLVLMLWVLEMTLAWALIFVPEAFSDGSVAGFDDRLVFAAQTVLGRAGNSPALKVADGGWKMLHPLAGLTGVVLVSVGLAYVLPILASVAQKRSVAAFINGIGSSVDEMRELAAASGGQLPAVDALGPHLVTMANQITLVAERHRAYPVLHHDDDPVELVIDPSRASAKDLPSPPPAWMQAHVRFDGWTWREIERGDATLGGC